MKTKSFLTGMFVLEETWNAFSVNSFLKAGSQESKTEVVSVTDLIMSEALFSHEG